MDVDYNDVTGRFWADKLFRLHIFMHVKEWIVGQ